MLLLRLPSVLTINLNPDQFSCPRCGAGLDQAELSGVQRNKSGLVQRYECQKCHYRFNDRMNFERLKSNPSLIVLSVDLYLRELSCREVQAHLKIMYSCGVAYTTVYRWVLKYCQILREVERAILPLLKLGRKWHGDELVAKVDDNLSYIWTILDSRSRYLLASSLQARRDTATFKKVISDVVSRVGIPGKFVTDGLRSYSEGLPQVDPRIRHVAGRKFEDKGNNNRVERANKSIRRRTDSAEHFGSIARADDLVNGFRVHYNLVRPHLSLGDMTPAESAGYKFVSDNRLLELINRLGTRGLGLHRRK